MTDAQDDFAGLLEKVSQGEILSIDEADAAITAIMDGNIDPVAIAAFLVALKVRGESVDEITGGAMALRRKAEQLPSPWPVSDTCGTGGDGLKTYNISTAAAFVCAASGVKVAKHGNRSVSSRSGSADILEALGAKLALNDDQQLQSLENFNFAFLFAPQHHQAMRHAANVRKTLKLRTIFNLLGPLANPAGAKHQLLGVYDKCWVRPMAEVLQKLGCAGALVVHGADGLDEISLSGPTYVAELKEGTITEYEIAPEDFGIKRQGLEAIKGGDAETNAKAMLSVLNGETSAYSDIVAMNAGAAIYIAGKAKSIHDGIDTALKMIKNGAAAQTLSNWTAFTKSYD